MSTIFPSVVIFYRHHKELEDLKKKHETQWIQLKSQIPKSKDVQNLGRELMEVRISQALTRSKSDVQLTAYEAATKIPNRFRPTAKSELSETGRKDGMMSKHPDEYAVCPAVANFTDSYKDIIPARPRGNAPPKENFPQNAQRGDANYPLSLINSHLMGSLYPTVSGVPQLTRSVDAHCVSPISQRQSELEMAKQLENQMNALISLRLMHQQQQLTNLDLAAKAQRPSVQGTGFFYALPNGCFQYSCMPTLQQLQSPTLFAAAAPPIYQETVCPPPPTNTFPAPGTSFPWNRTEFPQRMGSRKPCSREFVQHHVPGNVLPDPSRQFLCSSLEQLAFPSETARINASFAPSPTIVVKAQPPAAPPMQPCFDNYNNYLNGGYNNFPCFVNPFQASVPMSFLHPSMQYPPPDFKDLHQTFIPQPTDHQPYLTWS